MESSSGGRKRKSLSNSQKNKKAPSKAGSSDEDEWLCARTFKAHKIDNEVQNSKEKAEKPTKSSSKIVQNAPTTSPKWISRRSLNLESAKPKVSISTKSELKPKVSLTSRVWNVPSTKRKNVIEEVAACNVLLIPPIKTSNSIVSNASDVVPDSYTSTCSSSSSSSRISTSSIKSKQSPFTRSRSRCKTEEKIIEMSTCESPVLPCTPIRTSHVRRISQVVQDVEIDDSQKFLGCMSQSPKDIDSFKKRRNSLDSLSWKASSSSNSSESLPISETPKKSKRRCSLLSSRMESVEISPKREDNPFIMETMDIMGPQSIQKRGIPEKIVVNDFTQQLNDSIERPMFKVPALNFPMSERSAPTIDESCGDFHIQETCHIGLSESNTIGTERFEIDDLDGKSIRCDDYIPKCIPAVSPIRENQNKKRLPKLAGRLAKHLSSLRCERLIVRRDPRAMIISLPISRTYSNWGLTVHEVSGTGQLVFVRDKLQNSRNPASSIYSNNQAEINLTPTSLQLESKKNLIEKHVEVSKSHQIVPPSLSSAGSALRAVVGAGTDSALSTAAECWLHLAQPYSLIRTSSRQPPAIINPIVIDR